MSNDNIYYNFSVKQGVNTIYSYISTNENRTENILDNPSDYQITVERFTLPTSALPIMVWKQNFYRIIYTFEDAVIPIYLSFIPNSSGNDLYGDTIWTYQEFIDIINKALLDGLALLKSAKPAVFQTRPPFISLDSASRLLVWNIPKDYEASTRIYFNVELFNLMTGFQSFGVKFIGYEEAFFEMVCKDNKNNSTSLYGIPFYSTFEEYSTLFSINQFRDIIFDTDTIPTYSEFIMRQENDFRQILTDFEPINGENNKVSLQFTPKGEQRWYDLNSSKPLRNTDLKVFWQDKAGDIYPLYIDADKIFTMKLRFRKKI